MRAQPDAPRRATDGSKAGKAGPWLHWLVADCKDGSTASCSPPVMPYAPPTPPQGNHRYIFLLFRQSAKGVVGNPHQKRMQWDLRGFLKRNKDRLGPVAMSYFYTQAG